MHTLRALIFAVESGETARIVDDLAAHIQIAVESGLLMGQAFQTGARTHYPPASLVLTSQGRDFADLARNSALWHTVAERIAAKVGSTSLALWQGTLEAEHKKALDGD